MKSHFPVSAALFLASTIHTTAADWPNWLGPNKDGVSGEILPDDVTIGAPVWKADVGIGFSSISVANGSVYTMGHRDGKETVWKLSAESGDVEGRYTYAAELMPNLHEGGPGSTPTVADGRVFAISKDGLFHAFDEDLSEVIWKKDMMEESGLRKVPEWGFSASPVVMGHLVLVEAGATFAFDLKTG